ncbi:MAG: SPOR domain-containing protein [Limnochordia bacterium]|jgi:cell division septation protein DedD|nr:SPOR domain-containing protein [Limnochordia bacterium]MDD2628805.1 SPOR domain-containing protein [Limnochordia bacterium]
MSTDKKETSSKGLSKFGFAMVLVAVGACAIFIGFLIGQWLMDLLSPSTPTIAFDPTEVMNSVDKNNDPSNSLSADTVKSSSSPNTTSPKTEEQNGLYRVQVGSFSIRENAEQLANRLKAAGYEVYITPKPYRVQVGAFSQRSNAERLLEELKGLGYTDGFITQ